MKKWKILFVCTGNICRSPSADGVLRQRVDAAGLAHLIEVDSAGTQSYHIGEPPDLRSQTHAKKRGYDLSALRARSVQEADFAEFDLILAMDSGHLRDLQRKCPPEYQSKIRLFLSFAPVPVQNEVLDPYYGGAAGFEAVLDQVELGCDALLNYVKTAV